MSIYLPRPISGNLPLATTAILLSCSDGLWTSIQRALENHDVVGLVRSIKDKTTDNELDPTPATPDPVVVFRNAKAIQGPDLLYFHANDFEDEVDLDGDQVEPTVTEGSGDGDTDANGDRATQRERPSRARGGESVGNVNGKRLAKDRERILADLISGFDTEEDTRSAKEASDFVRNYTKEFAWLGKRPGMSAIPLKRASKLVANAEAIAGPKALWDWKIFLRYWRQKLYLGSYPIFTPPGSENGAETRPRLSQSLPRMIEKVGSHRTLADAIANMALLFQSASNGETFDVVNRVYQRLRVAFLYQEFEATLDLVPNNNWLAHRVAMANNRKRKRPGTLARDDLFKRLWEETNGKVLGSSQGENGEIEAWRVNIGNASVQRERKRFDRMLIMGKRWSSLMARFGDFILFMIPGEEVLDSWVERLNAIEFEAWSDLIEEFNKRIPGLRAHEPLFRRLVSGEALPARFCLLEKVNEEAELDSMLPEERFELLEFSGDNEP